MADRPRGADRGVSEVLGFVLIFALITSSVGVVYVVGFDGLVGARNYERLNNAERAFDVLADNVDDITNRRAPSRATEIKLADAELRMGPSVVMNVSGERYDHPAENFSHEFTIQAISYDSGSGTIISYANGALIREERSGAVMHHEPGIFLSQKRTLVPVVETHATGTRSVAGSKTVLVRTDVPPYQRKLQVARSEGTYNVTFNVTTATAARAEAWERYLDSEAADPETCGIESGTTVTCSITGTERVYVTVTRIGVSFE